jgi:ATP-binding cassette subfamily F protein 3
VLQYAQAATGMQRPEAQALLGSSFSGYAHEKPVVALSGGEQRLDLAVVASGANFLVLDEPTNHLDLETREALEDALEAFPGTLLLVSHDRALLDAVATRILSIEDGPSGLRRGLGGLPARREAGTPCARTAGACREAGSRRARPPRGPTELERTEAAVADCERRITELEQSLAEDWANVDTIAAHRRARDELGELLARWETLLDAEQAAAGPAS